MTFFFLLCVSCDRKREHVFTNKDSILVRDTIHRAPCQNDSQNSQAESTLKIIPKYNTELFAKRILDRNFFQQERQSDNDYVLLLEYLYFDNDEQYTEEVGESLCNMLQQFPQRYSRIEKTLTYFPQHVRPKIRNEFLTLLIATYYMQQDSVETKEIMVKKIYRTFPFISHNKTTDAMILNLYDNYCTE